ncbi:hypothetical protein NPIL_74631 [Nephila pilipes]|uniref:Uncharacterized protein n=1 Tax=Nephila pilipes TaxID=299642 RepID=A0A8X6NNJ2_NEPPI|nr:hypothetical protein NPIL_74631 [Nephila pilipes]
MNIAQHLKGNVEEKLEIEEERCLPEIEDTTMDDVLKMMKYPASLPAKPFSISNENLLSVMPKPRLNIWTEKGGIVLQWDMHPNIPPELSSFEIFGYEEKKNLTINSALEENWLCGGYEDANGIIESKVSVALPW